VESPLVAEETFAEGERVLAYHQSLIYEAKVNKVETRIDSSTGLKKYYYLIHYAGWNERWDELVDSSRILKYTEESKKMQEDLKAEVSGKLNSIKKSKNSLNESKPKKRKLQENLDGRFKFELPLALRKLLVEDWDSIVNQKCLISLPRNPNVATIFEQFLVETYEENLASAESNIQSNVSEVISGVRTYFDKALGTLLLYRFERRQYSEILKTFPNKSMSDIYGVEHLLRLFVKFPKLMASVELDKDASQLVKSTIDDLLIFLNKNISSYSSPYEPATPQYIRLAT